MDTYRLLTFIHIVASVVLTGLALYWLVMVAAVKRKFSGTAVADLLEAARGARWPHVAVPMRFRLPLPWVFWVVLVVLIASGALIADVRMSAGGALYWTKLALVGAIAALQIPLTRRIIPIAVTSGFVLVLATVTLSAWMLR